MSNINAFVDSVGRIVVGEFLSQPGDETLRVKEPAVVNVQVSQENGQISVHPQLRLGKMAGWHTAQVFQREIQ